MDANSKKQRFLGRFVEESQAIAAVSSARVGEDVRTLRGDSWPPVLVTHDDRRQEEAQTKLDATTLKARVEKDQNVRLRGEYFAIYNTGVLCTHT